MLAHCFLPHDITRLRGTQIPVAVGLYLGYGRWSSKNERATVKKLPQIFSAFSLRRGWDVPRAAREGRPRLGTEFTTSFDTRTMPSKKMAQGKAVGSARPTALLF